MTAATECAETMKDGGWKRGRQQVFKTGSKYIKRVITTTTWVNLDAIVYYNIIYLNILTYSFNIA